MQPWGRPLDVQDWNVPWGSSEHLLSWWAQVGRMCATVLKPARSQPYFTVCCSSLTYMLGTRFFVNRVLCKAHQLRRILPSSTASQIRFDTIIFDRVLSWAISERLLHPVRWQRLRNLWKSPLSSLHGWNFWGKSKESFAWFGFPCELGVERAKKGRILSSLHTLLSISIQFGTDIKRDTRVPSFNSIWDGYQKRHARFFEFYFNLGYQYSDKCAHAFSNSMRILDGHRKRHARLFDFYGNFDGHPKEHIVFFGIPYGFKMDMT